ncbi:MAG TPA: histamine oxidase, partial [Streptosporangiaceae bacterium]|nr:histamine oxidase [Streptosporangiaceae bacterium]
MTDTALQPTDAKVAHPLDPVSAAEYLAGRQVMAAAGLLPESVRFAYYGLDEPHKNDVLSGGQAPDRRLRAFLIDMRSGESTDVVVSLTREVVVSSRVLDTRTDGQMPIINEDFAVAEEFVRADPQWRAAMARRGLTDVTKIRTCPLTAGSFDLPDEDGRRMVRVLAFVQADPQDYAWS